MGNEEKRARDKPHSECLHNGIILIVYILKILRKIDVYLDGAKTYCLDYIFARQMFV